MQLSFFDHAMKYQGGKKSIKFLNELLDIACENGWSELLLFDFVEDRQKNMIGEFV